MTEPYPKSKSAARTPAQQEKKKQKDMPAHYKINHKKAKKYPQMTAERIQKAIHERYINGNSPFFYALYNRYFNKSDWGWEQDATLIAKTLEVHEMEIKVSRGDFFADFSKEEKHSRFAAGLKCTPNKFSYVCPNNMIEVEFIPEYAGLIFAHENGNLEIIRKAPVLHNEKLDDDLWQEIAINAANQMNFKQFQRLQR